MAKRVKGFMMKQQPFKIVITGAESTGKSQLAKELENHYNAIRIPELARTYIEQLDHHYTYEDVEAIAKKQIENETLVSNSTSGIIIFDTWLIITKVWFEFVYGKTPNWLTQAIEHSNIDLFLLCDTNLPWIPDPVRENGGKNRLLLQEKYINELLRYNFQYKLVSGFDNHRTENAIQIIDQYLFSGSSI